MSKDVREVLIENIEIGEYEQRVSYEDDDIGNMAASIKRIGLIYPIIVTQDGNNYKLVEGHRRLLAHKMLGRSTVLCSISDPEKVNSTEIAFAGNFFRKELSQIELAASIADAHEKDDMSIEELAAGFHKSEHWTREMIAVTKWPQDVQLAVHKRYLSLSAASNLALITDDAYRNFLIQNAVQGGATARSTASWLQAWRAMQPVEEAINAELVETGPHRELAVPQAPCFCCAQNFDVDQVSHVPVCSACIQILRKVGEV